MSTPTFDLEYVNALNVIDPQQAQGFCEANVTINMKRYKETRDVAFLAQAKAYLNWLMFSVIEPTVVTKPKQTHLALPPVLVPKSTLDEQVRAELTKESQTVASLAFKLKENSIKVGLAVKRLGTADPTVEVIKHKTGGTQVRLRDAAPVAPPLSTLANRVYALLNGTPRTVADLAKQVDANPSRVGVAVRQVLHDHKDVLPQKVHGKLALCRAA